MAVGYWFIQPYRIGGKRGEAERRCADFGAVVQKVEAFKAANMDPGINLRVHVPAHATDEERRQIRALGVESI